MGNGYTRARACVCVCVCVCVCKGELCTHSVCALVKTREGLCSSMISFTPHTACF